MTASANTESGSKPESPKAEPKAKSAGIPLKLVVFNGAVELTFSKTNRVLKKVDKAKGDVSFANSDQYGWEEIYLLGGSTVQIRKGDVHALVPWANCLYAVPE